MATTNSNKFICSWFFTIREARNPTLETKKILTRKNVNNLGVSIEREMFYFFLKVQSSFRTVYVCTQC